MFKLQSKKEGHFFQVPRLAQGNFTRARGPLSRDSRVGWKQWPRLRIWTGGNGVTGGSGCRGTGDWRFEIGEGKRGRAGTGLGGRLPGRCPSLVNVAPLGQGQGWARRCCQTGGVSEGYKPQRCFPQLTPIGLRCEPGSFSRCNENLNGQRFLVIELRFLFCKDYSQDLPSAARGLDVLFRTRATSVGRRLRPLPAPKARF